MGDSDDERYSDWEENEEESCVVDLFSPQTFQNVKDLILFNQQHGFDILGIITTGKLDEIAIIMLVNFIRSEVKGVPGDATISFKNSLREMALAGNYRLDEKFMRPVLEDDSLLFLLGEYVVNNKILSSSKEDAEWEADQSFGHLFDKVTAVDSLSQSHIKQLVLDIGAYTESDETKLTGDYYFDGYSHIGIHETMLRDAARTNAYGDALLKNSEFLKGKVVLDIGCGTGILCLFAARAGARKVVGVDCSSIAVKAREIVHRNGFDDVITIVRGRLEEVELPLEEGEVDVIVSEWMGYGLYYENMLPAVLAARDKYMKGFGGAASEEQKSPSRDTDTAAPSPAAMLPSHSLLFLEAASVSPNDEAHDSYDGDRVGWWKNVYGFDMRDMAPLFTAEAQVDLAAPESIVSDRAQVHSLEVMAAVDEDLDFEMPFALVIS
jgi:type I protein arginine methyltransferase